MSVLDKIQQIKETRYPQIHKSFIKHEEEIPQSTLMIAIFKQ